MVPFKHLFHSTKKIKKLYILPEEEQLCESKIQEILPCFVLDSQGRKDILFGNMQGMSNTENHNDPGMTNYIEWWFQSIMQLSDGLNFSAIFAIQSTVIV